MHNGKGKGKGCSTYPLVQQSTTSSLQHPARTGNHAKDGGYDGSAAEGRDGVDETCRAGCYLSAAVSFSLAAALPREGSVRAEGG